MKKKTLKNSLKKIKNHNGFSLIEILVAIIIVTVIATIGLANFTHYRKNMVLTELMTLANTVIEAQHEAMIRNTPQTITFYPEQKKYSWDGLTHTLNPAVMFGIIPGVKGPPSTPTTFISNPITFKNNQLIAHPDGIIDPGTVYLVDSSQKFMYAITIGISQVSYLRTYRYETGWKALS
jgi:prepilin-type N-terminal cleavage/methylation domain-containing protein